jgi:Fic family protein
MQELFLFEAGAVENDSSEVREVWNHVNALDRGLERLREIPVCNRLIKEVHLALMTGVRGGDKTPGEFRTRQNYIGAKPTALIKNASYVPPPVDQMILCMNQLEDFINGRIDLPPLIRQALIHYQFEAVHPFQDGNGRVGRLLLTLDLCAEKIVEHPLLYVSEYIEQRKDEYYQLLFNISAEGAWVPWIEFFLRAVIHQAQDAQMRAKQLHDLMQEHRERLMQIKAPASTFRVLDELFFVPVVSSVTATKTVGGTVKTGLGAIERLQHAGILKEMPTGRKRNKIYIAEEIHQLVTT